jgi:hypothetical protein
MGKDLAGILLWVLVFLAFSFLLLGLAFSFYR